MRAMGADLVQVWRHPNATAVTCKRITRAVLREIVVRVEKDEIRLALHWQGGDHTELTVRKNRTGLHRWGSSPISS
jgi:hypothetical protein